MFSLNKRKRENTIEHTDFYSHNYTTILAYSLLALDAQKELNTIPHFAFSINSMVTRVFIIIYVWHVNENEIK